MEFKTFGVGPLAENGSTVNAYLLLAVALWVLFCGSRDAVILVVLRIVLRTAGEFCRAAFAPRHRTCPAAARHG